MDENYNNSDKITIRVKISDDDYQDILIDGSKETVDLTKSIFEQLSIFTGIRVEQTTELSLKIPSNRNGQIAYYNIENINFKRWVGPSYPPFVRRLADFARDGDCFRLQTVAKFDMIHLDYIYVRYDLLHQDLIDETGCNRNFCHQIGSRTFLDKLAQVFNSDIDSYLQDLPDRPRPIYITDPRGLLYFITTEILDAIFSKISETINYFNIGQYFYLYCVRLHYNRQFPRLGFARRYCPDRG